MPEVINWKTRPIFITSTFRNMPATLPAYPPVRSTVDPVELAVDEPSLSSKQAQLNDDRTPIG